MERSFILAGLLLAFPCETTAQWFVDGETGAGWSLYNDVMVPGDTGTEFSLTEDLETDPCLFFRLRFGRTSGRHSVSVLAAPLWLEANGSCDEDILFDDTVFPAGTPLQADYRFDSYRLTYRYAVVDRENLDIALGATAKLRVASIEVEGGGMSAITKNTGAVPLISFGLDWNASDPLHVILDGDAAVGPAGRAEDVFLGLGWAFDPTARLTLGWRILEGGADVDESRNFTMVDFASLGFRLIL
ncbi:MAG TPA: hypothetical protein PLF04_03755 [Candidatus Fermentibacter daniensis]|nr:hypothetical protein [Candidatus Fermentibacter daniensis]HOZ17431.1 hypothetical protein [Candidatus Fermentibacter daniensis]HPH39067.1 hypothetical protein [Candidatus Fermentibacter daniensis]HPN61958.1 hypothetical protein [Candidatus Fermentibacter daniensis]HQM41701.1 hypothetical protein [Candidatus Fermentibacter daniensis]